jgi:antitoxin (DNA-binding transcriptional repressor) of toxin-antitoxin stability system
MQTITATELARHTRKILDDVVARGETVAVERNHVLIARIVPSTGAMTAAQALAGLQPTLTPQQAADWLADSRSEFNEAVSDPWA